MKHIVVFSDGTGNSSAKLFKTNVWRLHEAVDTSDPGPNPPASQVPQIVVYDDGVGTSTFKPLALLGGAFGVGLRRNVLELYRFVCRNYDPGDKIFAFGFSRGAFTIRVLIGLITRIGLVHPKHMDHETLNLLSEDAYRQFRRSFRLAGNRYMNGGPSGLDWTDVLVTPLRNLRDWLIAHKRRLSGKRVLRLPYDVVEVPEIAFVGVWDTVAAYGFPIAEVTKGIDRWIWPLSMPDYKLSPKVSRARHALALDDERDTFHPLLWDEVHEQQLVSQKQVDEDRLRQVWFAGMHSDVGGGYSNDSLAYVSLLWMAAEAASAGLRLKPREMNEYRGKANSFGPIHDSRSGLAAYYRYQPRKIAARIHRPDPTTKILQDPDLGGNGLLTSVRVHTSVLERIADGTDGYAPIVLPDKYSVEGGPAREQFAAQRAQAQEQAWDSVWRRRVNYFATLAATLVLLSMGFWGDATSCLGPQCVVSPLIRTVGGWLPSFAAPWIDAYAARPGTFLVLLIGVFLLMGHTGLVELRMRDRMRRLFRLSVSSPPGFPPPGLVSAATGGGIVRRLRTGVAYQSILHFFKWRALPAGAATLIAAIAAVVAVMGLSLLHRAHLAISAESLCNEHGTTADSRHSLATSDFCWRLDDTKLVAGERYQLRLQVTERWQDGAISASPAGFSTREMSWWVQPLAPLFRRSLNDNWFQPLIHTDDYLFGYARTVAVPMRLAEHDAHVYVGEFTAPADGKVRLTVNDAVFLWGGDPTYFYEKAPQGINTGGATVTITPCAALLIGPACVAGTE